MRIHSLWNKVNSIIPNNMAGMTRPWIDPATDKRRTYYNICIIKYFLDITWKISQNFSTAKTTLE